MPVSLLLEQWQMSPFPEKPLMAPYRSSTCAQLLKSLPGLKVL